MAKATDIQCIGATLFFLPVKTRVPLKFGAQVVTSVTCARVRVTVTDRAGQTAAGWGETPLSVAWTWPSALPYEIRHERMLAFCRRLAESWPAFPSTGHPMELGWDFQEQALSALLNDFNRNHAEGEPMPRLAALVCCSPFDLALHDAFGQLLQRPVYQTYTPDFLNRTLDHFLDETAFDREPGISFADKVPGDFLTSAPPGQLPAWHLVGGLDPLDESELTGNEPDDGYPVTLIDWIRRDGLNCLKVKLRGADAAWDFQRLVKVGRIARDRQAEWLSADFNCTVTDPAYVNEILDHLRSDHPRTFARLLYVEQPFPYELEEHRIDVRSVAARKPLFLDESAHDWRLVKLGRDLGWTGVALKTCKTQTGAILSACWARAHGMQLMVQDLTNPMLAQIPHAQLAAHTGTIMGVETNAMQFYPDASLPEEKVHPGLYRRRGGMIDLSTARGPGFGYRIEEIKRELPEAAAHFGAG